MDHQCPCPKDLTRAIKSDADRCLYSLFGDGKTTVTGLLRVFLLFPGLWAMIVYRLAHHCCYQLRPRAAGRLLYGPASALSRLTGIALGIDISPHAHIGYGFFVNHFGGIHLAEATIGDNCNISHGVTIGNPSGPLNDGPGGGAPVLGDRVWVGPGATITGPVTVGHDSAVAGNSLVAEDVPAFSVMMGVPAVAVSQRGSFAQVRYRGLDTDRGRETALAAQTIAAARQVRPGERSRQPKHAARRGSTSR